MAVAAQGAALAEEAVEKNVIFPVDLRKTSSAGPEPCKVHAWMGYS